MKTEIRSIQMLRACFFAAALVLALVGCGGGGGGGGGGGTPASTPASPAPSAPSPRLAYFVPPGKMSFPPDVSVFQINPTTGALSAGTQLIAGAWLGLHPSSIDVDPTARFAYVGYVDAATNISSVQAYTIDRATGALTPVGTAFTVGTSSTATPVVVDPTGRFLYVTSALGNSIFSINQTTGALTLVGSSASGRVVVDPRGKFAYTLAVGTGVVIWSINQTTGTLTKVGTDTTTISPGSAAVDPTGKFFYVATQGSGGVGLTTYTGGVDMFTINQTTGALTKIGAQLPLPSASSVTVDPAGKFVYVDDLNNGIYAYAINQTTGALTQVVSFPSLSLGGFVIDKTGAFAYAYNASAKTMNMYAVNSTTGALTAGPTVPYVASDAIFGSIVIAAY